MRQGLKGRWIVAASIRSAEISGRADTVPFNHRHTYFILFNFAEALFGDMSIIMACTTVYWVQTLLITMTPSQTTGAFQNNLT